MVNILSAITGDNSDGASGVPDVVKVKRALVSVYDKTGVVEFCTYLQKTHGVELLSTGGTAKKLREAGLEVKDVSEYTGAAECLDGRVKTLHPKVHGGLLAVRNNEKHQADMEAQEMQEIDMTIVNLYPFEQAVAAKDTNFATCIENIDIGGPSMVRSTAKNHNFTTIVTSASQYSAVQTDMANNDGGTTLLLRKHLAAQAFALTAQYDSAIASWFSIQMAKETTALSAEKALTPVTTRVYQPEFPLKYGCNPHQQPSFILSRLGSKLPFEVLNGTPGYINLLDAANAWQLVKELREATGLAAAASFKHVSPAGAAVAVPLTEVEKLAYEVTSDLTPVALAYTRARNADPLCSFGDFCAVSDPVDEATALILKKEVSDGIIAPSYSPEALAILASKKGGKYIILQATPDYDPGEMEYREVYGMTFAQKRNDIKLTKEEHLQKIVTTKETSLSEAAQRDLLVASICLKYTQSNSVGFATNGMMVGVGAGQQSRVDCVQLAGRKVRTWYLRQHPRVLKLPFNPDVKRQARVNARVRYIAGGDWTEQEKEQFDAQFSEPPAPLTEEEQTAFMKSTATGISLSSDAFFPFRDSIDCASRLGVSYVAQPGGSVQDDQVIQACDDYGMAMCFTNTRLFHH